MKHRFLKTLSNCKNIIRNTKILLSYIKSEKDGNKYFIYKFLQSIVSALFPLVLLTLPGLLINSLTDDVWNINECIVYVSLILFLPLLNYFINLFLNYKLKKTKLKIVLGIDIKYYKYVMKMEYELYDNPDIQINKTRSLSTLSKVWNVSDILFGFITQAISLVSIIVIISFLNPFLIIIVILFSIFSSIIKQRVNKKLFALDQKGSEIDRRMWGITYMMDNKDYAKEIRLFNISNLLLNEYEKVSLESLDLDMEYLNKQNIPSNFNIFFELVQNILIY